jgi:hypothetical protein
MLALLAQRVNGQLALEVIVGTVLLVRQKLLLNGHLVRADVHHLSADRAALLKGHAAQRQRAPRSRTDDRLG